MNQLCEESTNVLTRMIGLMECWCIKIDYSSGAYKPVFISLNYEDSNSKIFVVGHYYSEEGEIMADPEMHFLYDVRFGSIFPIYYRQDGLDVEQSSVIIDDGLILNVNKDLQVDHTDFANQWLLNIKNQQNL